MTKEEMKNRISMALKDPILQQGFEIICKEIAEQKEQQFSLRNERNTFLAQNEQYEKDLIDINENLIKTKELLKKIEKIVYSGESEIKRLSKIVDILAEAEHFLSEAKND